MAKPAKKTTSKKVPPRALSRGAVGAARTVRRGVPVKVPAKGPVKRASSIRPVGPGTTIKPLPRDPLPETVDEGTIARLVAEAEEGIPAKKLRRRGRPAIGEDASSTYSVRLPDDLVTLTDERSAIDGVSRGETIRRALIEYLTK